VTWKIKKFGKLHLETDLDSCKSWNCKRHVTWLWLCHFRAGNAAKINWHLSKTVTWPL